MELLLLLLLLLMDVRVKHDEKRISVAEEPMFGQLSENEGPGRGEETHTRLVLVFVFRSTPPPAGVHSTAVSPSSFCLANTPV